MIFTNKKSPLKREPLLCIISLFWICLLGFLLAGCNQNSSRHPRISSKTTAVMPSNYRGDYDNYSTEYGHGHGFNIGMVRKHQMVIRQFDARQIPVSSYRIYINDVVHNGNSLDVIGHFKHSPKARRVILTQIGKRLYFNMNDINRKASFTCHNNVFYHAKK